MEGRKLIISVILMIGFSIEVSEAAKLCDFAAKFPDVTQQCYRQSRTDTAKPTESTTPNVGRATEQDKSTETVKTAVDCSAWYQDGVISDGVYTIKPANWTGSPFDVYCNMTAGGGWTVFQRRVNGSVDFYRDWTNYKEGFGELTHEFWLGNDKLYYLTNQGKYALWIDMVNEDGEPFYAVFDFFRINDESDNYRLSRLGSYNGTAGQVDGRAGGCALSYHLNGSFSTFDRDNDHDEEESCAETGHGAWWYKNCSASDLNGDYHSTADSNTDIWWYGLPSSPYNLKYTEMKIRPM